MSYESGSLECRRLIESKENLIKIMQTMESFENTKHINVKLKEIYKEIEEMHQRRIKIEFKL